MSLMRLLQFRKGQLLVAVVLLALAYFAYPEFFEDAALLVVAAVAAYVIAYYVHYAIRLYVFRRVVAFDVGGVLLTGDFWTEELRECPGIKQLLNDLRERYVIAILSNNNELLKYGFEKRFGFQSLFDEVIFSSQTGAKKPDEAMYKHFLKRFGIAANRAVFVDDMPENVAAAEKLGIKGVVFNCNKQSVRELRVALHETGISV